MKKCTKCFVLKDYSEFYKSPKGKDGLWAECKNCKSKYRKEYYLKNKDKEIANAKEWSLNNREACNKSYRKYYENNKSKEHARSIYKKAVILERTVPWADYSKIQEFYKEAKRLTKETNIKHHVDHIIPLKGKLVSGLHVETNLQVITATQNLSKSNKFNPDKTVTGESNVYIH